MDTVPRFEPNANLAFHGKSGGFLLSGIKAILTRK
jgi:hypothetical protein